MSNRFHDAARDGNLDILRDTTRRDCNHPDEDGLTPTSLAAHEGNLEALRLLVARGGDPDKCDHFGNTALHCAAARGHMKCVTFLANFGANLWAEDNENHTPKELAAMNDRDEILRYLDTMCSKQENEDPKKVKVLKEKAQKNSDKRRKEFDKIQKNLEKKRELENEKLQKERQKIEQHDSNPQADAGRKKSFMATISRGSVAFLNPSRKDSKLLYTTNTNNNNNNNNNYNSPNFSELTITNKKNMGGLQKKIIRRKIQDENKNNSEFKVSEGDGKRSVRSLSGLQRGSEILLVPNGSMSSSATSGKRGKISDVFDEQYDVGPTGSVMNRTASQPDFTMGQDMHHRGSLFARPGFGSVAFRNSITATLSGLGGSDLTRPSSAGGGGSYGSESSLVNKDSYSGPWEDEDLPSEDEEEATPVYLFVAAAGLADFIPVFAKEHIDMDALMLLTEEDLMAMKLPMGPRRKLLNAIKERKGDIEEPGELADSRL